MNILTTPQPISKKLSDFCKYDCISRSQCWKLIVSYIETHCIVKEFGIVILDDKLADVLNFKEFQKNVRQGKFFRIDSDWVIEMFKQWDNGIRQTTYTCIMHMLSQCFNK